MPADVFIAYDCHTVRTYTDVIATALGQGEIPRDPNFLPLITPTRGVDRDERTAATALSSPVDITTRKPRRARHRRCLGHWSRDSVGPERVRRKYRRRRSRQGRPRACRVGGQRRGGRTAKGFTVDLADTSRLPSLVRDVVDGFGRIDILVNCAGISGVTGQLQNTVDFTDDEFETVMHINLRARSSSPAKSAGT